MLGRFLLITCLVLSAPLNVLCQATPNLEEGIKPYASLHGGDTDSVNLSNGNLNLSIPLVSFPQKGDLKLDFSLQVNTKNWVIVPYFQRSSTPPTYSHEYWRWKGLGVTVTWNGNWHCMPSNYVYDDEHPVPTQDAITDPTGAVHSLVLAQGVGEESADGSGINSDAGCNSVTDRSGIKYTSASSISNNNFPNDAISDEAGNSIKMFGYNFPGGPFGSLGGWTDSVGRTIPGGKLVNSFLGSSRYGDYLHPVPAAYGFFPGAATQGIGNCPAGTQSAAEWDVPAYTTNSLHAAPYQFCYSPVALSTNFQQVYVDPANNTFNVLEANQTVTLLTAVVLPTLQMWQFHYDNYGEVDRVTLPTGGTMSYGWATKMDPDSSRYVVSRTVNAVDGTGDHIWTYDYASGTTRVIGPAPNYDSTEHYFSYFGSAPFETETRWYNGSGSGKQLLKTVDTHYRDTSGLAGEIVTIAVPDSITTTYPTLPPSKQTMSSSYVAGYVNGSGNTSIQVPLTTSTIISTYDYGATIPMRTITKAPLWQTDSSYLAANLLDQVSSAVTTDGSGIQVARSDYSYDEPTYSVLGKAGKLTTTIQWLNGGSSPTTHVGWNSVGQESYTIDARVDINANGHTSDFEYNQCNNSFLSMVTNVLGHRKVYGYDCPSGLLTSFQNPNDLAAGRAGTLYTYNSMDDLQTVLHPDGGLTSYDYHGYALPINVTTTVAASPDPSLVSNLAYDGLGRQVRATAPSGAMTDTTYDAQGRVYTISNPYFSTSDITYGLQTFNYDGLNRKTLVSEPDGAAGVSTLQSSYSGNLTDSYDEAGKHWRRTMDALGRLTDVAEPDPSTSAPTLLTHYGYDALGNLISVTQSGNANIGEVPRNRRFSYDSLSRLLKACNPEAIPLGQVCDGISNWSEQYSYDPNGNLSLKTDARPITTAFTYDLLNRIKVEQAPGINYQYSYDALTGLPVGNGIGRLVYASNSVNADEVFSYDAVGRMNWQSSFLPSAPNHTATITTANYDLAGNLVDLSYPDGHRIQQAWDSAGHLCNLTDTTTGTINCTTNSSYRYLSSPTYFPNGALNSATFGNGIVENYSLNNRLQPTEIAVQNASGTKYMDKQYCYGPATASCLVSQPASNYGNAVAALMATDSTAIMQTANNGNVVAVLNAVNPSRSQAFGYDNLNRIRDFSNTNRTMSQCFSIDSFGNAKATCGTLFWDVDFDLSSPSNRVSGYGYDAVGNVNQVPLYSGGTQPYNYDSENQLVSIGNPVTASYTYDANGARVRKDAAGSWTEYVSFGGVPIGEKNSSGGWSDYIFANGQRIARLDPQVHFYSADNLGTTTVITDNLGVLQNDSDYYPFGAENAIASPDPNHYKFTGKERDAESGLDYFGARYYASSMGRWMSPDWADKPEAVPYSQLDNPQSLNLYGYVNNNPLSKADPDGHCPECIAWIGEELDEASATPTGQSVVNAIGATVTAGFAIGSGLASDILSNARPPSYVPGGSLTDANGNSIFSSKTGATNAPAAPAAPAADDKPPQPLVGNNPKDAGTRTNTDLPGGHAASTQTFGDQTSGQNVRTDPKTGHQVSADGSRLRLNPDGTARVDLPNRGTKPNGETIHFNNPDPKHPDPKQP